MKILVISDTHRKNDEYLRLIQEMAPIDMIIHCGDAEGSEYLIREAAGCPVKIVLGNNDFFSELPKEEEFQLEGYHVFITHGHNYYVSMGNETLKEEARARKADIVFYGHTHKPVVDIEEDLITVNPGSLTYPRQEGRKPSYIIMEIDKNRKVHFQLEYLRQ